MIRLRFPTPEAERRALGYLAGRFSFKTYATGETLVPAAALPFLAGGHPVSGRRAGHLRRVRSAASRFS